MSPPLSRGSGAAAAASGRRCVDTLTRSIWPLEVANVLLVAERRHRLTPADSARFVELLAGLPITVDHSGQHLAHGRILDLAHRAGLSAYDASYLELAMRLGVPLATADDRLCDAADASGVPLMPGRRDT